MPPLLADVPVPDRKSPQAAKTVAVRWKASSSGGVGTPSFGFVLSDGEKETEVQKGPSPEWAWRPEAAGRYRVKAVATDALGNRAESGWSEGYEVAPPLLADVPVPDRKSPQAAKTVAVQWKASSSGGVGTPSFGFVLSDGEKEMEVQKGSSREWAWRPEAAGRYRLKAVATDALGNRAESGWSEGYEVNATIGRGARIAVFPVQNISGSAAPSREVTNGLKMRLAARNLNILDDHSLEKFMAKHRVRYTGGLTTELGRMFRMELGVDAVFIASLDRYVATDPPNIGITARLVSTEEATAILWVDGESVAGNQNPGLLDLGLVTDPDLLKAKAIDRIVESADRYLSGKRKGSAGGHPSKAEDAPAYRNKFLPRGSFRHPGLRFTRRYKPGRVAVLPFLDRSTRPYAGEVMAQQFVRGFSGISGIEVVEPGVVRQVLLQSRLIMEGGLSFAQAELLRELLGVEYVITGEVMEYQDSMGYEGTPYAEFSAYVIDANHRQVVWTSSSYNRGDDRVFFFNWGKTYTAGALVSEMVRAVADLFLRRDAATDAGVGPATGADSGLR